ncbi:MAG: hypothetical protein Q8L85_08010 [Alphaproteobacteria bacterium]|nr:hypothetical protein [Alphaproteobacteria bacterium]
MKNKKIEQVKKNPSKKSFGLFSFLMLVSLSIVFKATFVLLIIALLPTLVMFFVERKTTQYLTFCIGTMNLMGTIPFVFMIWKKNHGITNVLELFAMPKTWLIIYGGAAIGLAIYSIMPSIVKFFRTSFLRNQLAFAEKEKQKILDDWGIKIDEKEEK